MTCEVATLKGTPSYPVHILDISPGGLSFSVKNAIFSIGDAIRVTFTSCEAVVSTYEGEVLSQNIFYLNNSEHLKDAFFRFSVRLKPELKQELQNEIQASIKAQPEVILRRAN